MDCDAIIDKDSIVTIGAGDTRIGIDNSRSPVFTVCMANYNNGEYLGAAIESVMKQTFENWELIIVDDASTDYSREALAKISEDKRLRVYENRENVGYIETLRRIIRKSRSNLVGVLDSDDTLRADAIEQVVGAFTSNSEVGLVYSQHARCDLQMRRIGKGFAASIPENKSNIQFDCISAFRTFRKDVYFQTTGFDDEAIYAEDKDLYLKLEEVAPILFLDEELYNYRVLSTSQGHEKTKSEIGRISKVFARYRAFCRRRGTDIPNLSHTEMLFQLRDALHRSIRLKDPIRVLTVMEMAFEMAPMGKRLTACLHLQELKEWEWLKRFSA